ncbi:MAG: dynamin family protein [Actinobacteria bacterium]|nr:dynamin family protein [Actinomycetota bacterium]MBO0788517.1 dynamin family protein [Actinomycetota bacterium]
MSATGDADPLLAALTRLALGGDGDRAVLAELRDRLAGHRLRVLVAGEAKRGKSTLVNALLGRAVLPTGVTPLTALPTTVRYGREERVTAVFRDGRTGRYPLAALEDLVTERGNPGNRRGLASVTVAVDAPVLARGAELVDTPGTGSVYAHDADAETALETMDAAVFVLTADPPASAAERDLMRRVAGLSVKLFVVLNKADYLAATPAGGRQPARPPGNGKRGHAQPGSELAEAMEFTAKVAGEATGGQVRLYPVSARAAVDGTGDPGFTEFENDFTGYLDTGRAADLRLSVAGHARRLAGSLRDEADLARRAAEMRSGDAAGRVAAFTARLTAVAGRRQDAADLAAADSARMLADLNEAAGQAVRQVTAGVAAQMEALIGGELRSAAAADIERAGRRRLAELAVQATETWRGQQAERLEEGLARLDQRLTGDLRAELNAVREAAADLLGLNLTVPGPGERLVPDLRFFYLTGEQAGQTELLAGAIRRALPGEAGRRRARTYLRRETADLVPQQIGRARADLQYRLAESTRRLTRAVGARYDDSTGRLHSALLTASAVRQATAAEAARLDSELAGRQQALAGVLSLLDQATADAGAASRTG